MHSKVKGVKLSFWILLSLAFACLVSASIAADDKNDGGGMTVSNAGEESKRLTDNGDGSFDKKMSSKVFSDAKSFDKLYIEGENAYFDHLWYSCAHKLEKAIKQYKTYKRISTDCRLNCLLKDKRTTKMSNFTFGFETFAGFSYFLNTADCIRRCREEHLGDQKHVTPEYDSVFEERKPYQYLQYCYFKLDKLKQAASAAYTHFLANPNNTDSKSNMDFYKITLKTPPSDFLDMEMVPYREFYIRGTIAYSNKDWPGVIASMEDCLTEYFVEEERCRANCFDTGYIRGVEIFTGVADLIIRVMMCQMDCEEKLSKLYTEPAANFFESIFHYLQFAYYQIENIEKSAEATASFLLVNPSNKVMKENMEVIREFLNGQEFIARDSVQEYVKRKKQMSDDMDFINKNYRWGDVSEDEGDIGEEVLTEETEIPDDWMTRYEKLGMHVMAMSSDLHREERFITDGLLKQEQCDELMKLVKGVAKQDSGAQVFDLKLAKKTMEDRLDEGYESSLRMLVRASEVVRHYAQRFNRPDYGYVLKKTSIVCWNPEEDPTVHLPCYPQENGSCLKYQDMSEDFFKDLFTTVTYLTSPNEGGDFFFLGNDEEVDYSMGVRCGRTVGFNSGDRHSLHLPKTDTKRCAMVINHSTVTSDDEKDYQETIALLHHLDELRLERDMKTTKEIMKAFEKKGMKIAMTGEELQGKERFVADGMASDEECKALTEMVMTFGEYGDGYAGKKSPHTANEKFSGLSLDQVTKMTHSGKISTFAMDSFLKLSESSRLFVERYFNLTKPLYFDFTHLVCRTSVDDSNVDRDDLSHPVHADNCVLQPDGTCTKGFPAFTQRDYSAVLYLNDDFKGGDFFFAHSNTTEQVSVQPKCGRLVGFNAGEFHGVRAVTSGSRCAIALWFTLNPNFKELAHVQARKVVREMESKRAHIKPIHDDL